MMKKIQKLIIKLAYYLMFDKLYRYVKYTTCQAKLLRIERKTGQKINFVSQGGYEFDILGDLSNFEIHKSSHIKSDTYIECAGGVKIGSYFHCGRGLTIFSSNHNWRSESCLPYDNNDIKKKVIIGDYVWFGANVTILPGVKIGNGSVVAAGSVVTKDVPSGHLVGGNPAKFISKRNMDLMWQLEREGRFQ